MIAMGAISCSPIVREGDLFHPRKQPQQPEQIGRANVAIQIDDSTTLRGWYLHAPEHRRALIYCYGNAETVADIAPTLAWLSSAARCNILAVDYRGYGFSDGSPSLAALVGDGPRVFDYLRDYLRGTSGGEDIPILVFGRSLGAGAASVIAAERPVAGLILEAPPSSIGEVIPTWRSRFPWYARWAVGELRPDSSIATFHPQPIDAIRRVGAPLLVIHGTDDEVIPIRFGRQMFDAAPASSKEFLAVEGAGHNDVWISRPPVSDTLVAFIERNGGSGRRE